MTHFEITLNSYDFLAAKDKQLNVSMFAIPLILLSVYPIIICIINLSVLTKDLNNNGGVNSWNRDSYG